jgi:hypothetical protein
MKYYLSLDKLAEKIFTKVTREAREDLILNQFANNLLDERIYKYLVCEPCDNIEDYVKHAVKIEKSLNKLAPRVNENLNQIIMLHTNPRSVPVRSNPVQVPQYSNPVQVPQYSNPVQVPQYSNPVQVPQYSNPVQSSLIRNQTQVVPNQVQLSPNQCSYCKQLGHWKQDCSAWLARQERISQRAQANYQPSMNTSPNYARIVSNEQQNSAFAMRNQVNIPTNTQVNQNMNTPINIPMYQNMNVQMNSSLNQQVNEPVNQRVRKSNPTVTAPLYVDDDQMSLIRNMYYSTQTSPNKNMNGKENEHVKENYKQDNENSHKKGNQRQSSVDRARPENKQEKENKHFVSKLNQDDEANLELNKMFSQ